MHASSTGVVNPTAPAEDNRRNSPLRNTRAASSHYGISLYARGGTNSAVLSAPTRLQGGDGGGGGGGGGTAARDALVATICAGLSCVHVYVRRRAEVHACLPYLCRSAAVTRYLSPYVLIFLYLPFPLSLSFSIYLAS